MEQEFQPNWVSPPADTIKDILLERNISIEEFTKYMDLGENTTNLLLEGKWFICSEIADKLSKYLGSTVKFWIKRDGQYWSDLKRLNKITEKEFLNVVAGKLKNRELFPELNNSSKNFLKTLKIGEEAYIGDWKETPKQKIESKCQVIKMCVSDGTFTLNEALKAYNITSLQYKKYLDKNKLTDNQ